MIYFTSDLHLGHENIIKMVNRPFANVEKMNETLIKNWNNTIKQSDTVYILGDLTMKMRVDDANKIISKLNGKKILIRGNHDRLYNEELFQEICDYKELKYNKQTFILSHYPFEEWNHYFRGAIHLHGHQHNHSDYNYKMKLKGLKRYDVGVDANMYRPVSIEEVMRFFEEYIQEKKDDGNKNTDKKLQEFYDELIRQRRIVECYQPNDVYDINQRLEQLLFSLTQYIENTNDNIKKNENIW